MARYWKSIITATILTEGDAPPSFDTLAHVHEAITDGDASGEWAQQDAEVTEQAMRELLLAQGSEATFLIQADEEAL
jgi:hypothetical protein